MGCADHLVSFKYERYPNKAMMPKYIREVKMKRKTLLTEWGIIKKLMENDGRNCNLCMVEKLKIIEG